MTQPLLKWVGGKSRLAGKLSRMLPPEYQTLRHVEPFAGGAALFFLLAPKRTILSDTNQQLINTYRTVARHPGKVIRALRDLSKIHDKENYYALRDEFNDGTASSLRMAALFIYLNRTCYNGMWRVNKAGAYNVPIGRYKAPKICEPERIRAASQVLGGTVALRHGDFEDICGLVRGGDFVYLDPPYVPVGNDEMFVDYSVDGFDHDDQLRLRDWFRKMDKAGAKLMLSNSNCSLVRDLYKEWRITRVTTPRSVSSNPGGRGAVVELIVRNY